MHQIRDNDYPDTVPSLRKIADAEDGKKTRFLGYGGTLAMAFVGTHENYCMMTVHAKACCSQGGSVAWPFFM